jgi:ABC-type lipoprotein release transport system permease subunit
MKTLRFAVRSLVRQPGRSSLGILGVAAVGALLFDMLLLSRGLVVSFRDLLDSLGFDVRVTATDSPIPGGVRLKGATAAARDIAKVPSVAEVVPMRTADAEVVLPGHSNVGLTLTAIDVTSRQPWTLMTGSPLAQSQPPSLIVNQTLLARIGLPLGSQVSVRVVCDRARAVPVPHPFRIAGLAEFPFDDEAQASGVMLRSALRDSCAEQGDEADMLLVASRDGASAAVSGIRAARPDLVPITNEQIVARMQARDFTYFRQISSVLSAITLVFGFLLITVLLTVSVNQRLAEIAALRALGFSARRTALDVLAQGAMLVGLGGLLALPLGLALSIWLDRILKTMPGIPIAMHFFVFEPRALITHAVLLVFTTVLAAAYPMWLVARLPIAATLRNEVVG